MSHRFARRLLSTVLASLVVLLSAGLIPYEAAAAVVHGQVSAVPVNLNTGLSPLSVPTVSLTPSPLSASGLKLTPLLAPSLGLAPLPAPSVLPTLTSQVMLQTAAQDLGKVSGDSNGQAAVLSQLFTGTKQFADLGPSGSGLTQAGDEILLDKGDGSSLPMGRVKTLGAGQRFYHWATEAAASGLSNGFRKPFLNVPGPMEVAVVGGGLYVSIDALDSSHYGDALVVLENFSPIRVLELACEPALRNDNELWARLSPRLKALNIAAIRFSPTWLTLISGEEQMTSRSGTMDDIAKSESLERRFLSGHVFQLDQRFMFRKSAELSLAHPLLAMILEQKAIQAGETRRKLWSGIMELLRLNVYADWASARETPLLAGIKRHFPAELKGYFARTLVEIGKGDEWKTAPIGRQRRFFLSR